MGAVFSESGPWDARPAERSVKAYFNMVNEAGGVWGRKLELVAYDDMMDATTGRSLVRKLVGAKARRAGQGVRHGGLDGPPHRS